MTIRKFIALGLLWGFAISAIAIYELQIRPSSPLLLAIVLCTCLVVGAVFGLGMFTITRLLSQYGGLHLAPIRNLEPGPHSRLLIAAAIIPSAAIAGFAIFIQYDFLWAALAACIGPTFALVRLPAHTISWQSLVARSFLSVVVGAIAAITVAVGLLAIAATPSVIAMCFAYATAWTFAQLVALAVRPLNRRPPRGSVA